MAFKQVQKLQTTQTEQIVILAILKTGDNDETEQWQKGNKLECMNC